MSRCRTFIASTTAFTTAGVDPIVAASPMPFAPSGLRGVGVTVADVAEHRQVLRARHRVVHQRAREQLAVVAVAQVLPQRLRDALREAAVHLARDTRFGEIRTPQSSTDT